MSEEQEQKEILVDGVKKLRALMQRILEDDDRVKNTATEMAMGLLANVSVLGQKIIAEVEREGGPVEEDDRERATLGIMLMMACMHMALGDALYAALAKMAQTGPLSKKELIADFTAYWIQVLKMQEVGPHDTSAIGVIFHTIGLSMKNIEEKCGTCGNVVCEHNTKTVPPEEVH